MPLRRSRRRRPKGRFRRSSGDVGGWRATVLSYWLTNAVPGLRGLCVHVIKLFTWVVGGDFGRGAGNGVGRE